MRYGIFLIFGVFFLFANFASAQKGCCLNPNADTCEYTEQAQCCPEDSSRYASLKPADKDDCTENYFFLSENKNACLNLPERFNDYCTIGCCCRIVMEKEGNEKINYFLEDKASCAGEGRYWIADADKCSFETCQENIGINAVPKIITPKSGDGSAGQNEPCSQNSDCSIELFCASYNLFPEKNIKRCCLYPGCAGEENCVNGDSEMDFLGKKAACVNGRWRTIIESGEFQNENFDCSKDNYALKNLKKTDIDCLSNGGRPEGGLFHGGLIKAIFGGWCKDDETISDYKIGLLRKCCMPDYGRQFSWAEDPLKWMTPVKAQGYCGSCWAFATVAAAEAGYKISKNLAFENVDFSEQMLLSCSKAGSCLGGDLVKASDFLIKPGITDDECFPYSDYDFFSAGKESEMPCDDICSDWENRIYRFENKILPTFQKTANEAIYYINTKCIKDIIRKKGPIVAISNWEGEYDVNGVFHCTTDVYTSSHSIAVAGWDDNLSAWIYKNSWGAGWGDNGYGTIGYNECYLDFVNIFTGAQLGNPAAVYCNYLGYNISINETKLGQVILCNISKNVSVDAWRFIEGKVAKEYSICAKNGWEIKLKDDGKNSYSRDYSVCVIDGKEVAVTDLIGLESDLQAEPKKEPAIQKEENNRFPFYLVLIIFIFVILGLMLTRQLRKALNRK